MHFPDWLARLTRWWRKQAQRLQGRGDSLRPVQLAQTPPTLLLDYSARAYASVLIPALNEEKRIAQVVAYALSDPATAEVIVIDDSSTDRTAELAAQAGARVLTSSMLGKGASMRDGLEQAQSDIVVYLDGDLAGLRPAIISDLCQPLLGGSADFVKARFGRGGGRVTELTAKPMLKIFFPELPAFAQPLGGIVAARKKLLMTLTFEDDYGVDIGLLVDAHLAGAALSEVDIGSLEHDSQPLQDLTLMANEVGRVIFNRARAAGRLHVEQVSAMFELQRQAASGIDYILTRRKQRQRLLLLDMDGTITPTQFVQELAQATGQAQALQPLLEGASDPDLRRERIAEVFRYTHKTRFEQVARNMAIRPGVIEFVRHMKRQGFMVGVVSDSYFIAANILRRRIFADFAVAHTLLFDHEVCTGQVRINPAFQAPPELGESGICKSHVLQRFLNDPQPPKIDLVWVVGHDLSDLPLMRLADQAFAIDPTPGLLPPDAGITVLSSFADFSLVLSRLAPADNAASP